VELLVLEDTISSKNSQKSEH